MSGPKAFSSARWQARIEFYSSPDFIFDGRDDADTGPQGYLGTNVERSDCQVTNALVTRSRTTGLAHDRENVALVPPVTHAVGRHGGLRHDVRRALALAPLRLETGKPIDIGIAKHHAIPDDLRKRAYTSFGLVPRVAKAAQTKNPDPMRNAACGMVGSGSTRLSSVRSRAHPTTIKGATRSRLSRDRVNQQRGGPTSSTARGRSGPRSAEVNIWESTGRHGFSCKN
jgi:hypothetical protein